MAEDRAGELFAILFVTLFRRYPLQNLDRWMDDERGLEATVACTFYLLGKHGAAW